MPLRDAFIVNENQWYEYDYREEEWYLYDIDNIDYYNYQSVEPLTHNILVLLLSDYNLTTEDIDYIITGNEKIKYNSETFTNNVIIRGKQCWYITYEIFYGWTIHLNPYKKLISYTLYFKDVWHEIS